MEKSGKRYRVYRGGRARGSGGLAGRPGRDWSNEPSEPPFTDDPVAVEESAEGAAELAVEPQLDDTADGPELPEPVAEAVPYPDETFLPSSGTPDDEDDGDDEYADKPGPELRRPPPRAPRRRRVRVPRIRPWRFI